MIFGRVFSCNELHATKSIIPYCSVHLDARPKHAWNVIPPFRELTISCNELHATRSVIPDCSVYLNARPNHAGTLFNLFRVFTISCNKLHATGENDLTSVRDLRFRATSCTLRVNKKRGKFPFLSLFGVLR